MSNFQLYFELYLPITYLPSLFVLLVGRKTVEVVYFAYTNVNKILGIDKLVYQLAII